MKPTFAPDLFRSKLVKILEDTDSPVFGQAVTVDDANQAHVRTVHFKYVREFETIGFVANQTSRKWSHLLKNSTLSGCYFDAKDMIQFRWQSKAELIRPNDTSTSAQEVIARMWGAVRPTIRSVYWYDELKLAYDQPEPKDLDIHQVCPTFGIILCKPYFWDFYEMLDEDYRKHRRSEHALEGNAWKSTRVALLSARPL